MPQDIPVERIMHTGLLTCTPETPLCVAAARMAKRHSSSILVMRGQQAVGIWTEHDSLFVDFEHPGAVRTPIERVMSHPVICIHQATPIGEATLRFGSERRRHLLVVDDAGTPRGLLSQADLALNQGLEPYLSLREVGHALRDRPLLLQGGLSLNAAAERMRHGGCDAAVVMDRDQELGLITERDLVRFVARQPQTTTIGELASRPLLTIGATKALLHARDLLIDWRVRHLGVLDEQGEVVGLIGFQDLLAGAEHLYLDDLRGALEQRDQALSQSRRNLQLAERVIDSSLEGIIITDAQARIEFVNPAFTHMTGYSLEEAVGRTPAMLASGRHSADFYRDMWQILQEQGHWRGEIWNRRKSGQLYLELLTITAIRNNEGEVGNYAALFTDITDIRENEEQVRRQAYYDPLTQLPNRRLLEDRLALAIRHAHRHRQRLAVIFLDLDHFKQVNDALGHSWGDVLLLTIARRLREQLHEDDTLARLGGDEFIVLLNDVVEIDDVTGIARRLIDSVSAPFKLEGREFRVGCSLGISLYPDDGDRVEILVRHADAAMYRAKQEERNTYRLFRPEMHQQDHRRLEMDSALRDSVETGEGLSVHFQPLVERDSGAVHGAESLLRWYHPEFGEVSPGEFIPLAERSGVIVPLGERLMRLVAGQLRDWLDWGFAPPRIGINLSARQFSQWDLVERVRAFHDDYGLPRGRIAFELTESTLFDNHQQAVRTLEALRELDCRIAIDDFGTGYSSLSYLQELPVTTIKIDRSFIQGLGESRTRAAIVAAVTGLAKELGLRVVAEGVETRAQLEALSRYHVNLVQGFYTGPPVDADTFAARYLGAGLSSA